jgi:3-isopropylmalate/(R)-2-methylmalate dehydratase large subunit
MGMTITEKILAAHSGRDSVVPGEIVNAKIDLIVAHDVTTPPAVQMLKKLGINKVFDPTKIVVTPDHFVPNKDIKSAELAKQLREWREEQGITRYYEIGNHGICHAIAPEQGHVLPGMTGLWQISGRSGLEFDDLVRLDFTYIENWSIWSDVTIIARTIPADWAAV